MAMPIPAALRVRAVAAYEAGEGAYAEVAERFGVSRRALQFWVQLKRQTGSLEPRPRGGGNVSRVDIKLLHGLVAAEASPTTDELTRAYNRSVRRSGRVHRSSILRALHRAGYVFKKNALVRPSKTDPTSR
jgi:transposase